MKLAATILLISTFIYVGEFAALPLSCPKPQPTNKSQPASKCCKAKMMAHKGGCTKSPGKQTSNQTGSQSCDDQQSCIFCPLSSLATFTSVTKIEVPEVQVKKQYDSFLNGMVSHYSYQCFKPPDCM